MMYIKCIVCNKRGWKRFSPDLDLDGIGTCKKHFDDVFLAYAALIQGDRALFRAIIEDTKSLSGRKK